MNHLAIAFSLGVDQDDDAELPFTREAEAFLRPLLDSEQDPQALAIGIAAFASYSADVAAVLPHADHADPRVRARVSTILHTKTTKHEEAVAALMRLTDDPVPVTRTNALDTLATSAVDTPEVRAVFAAHLADPPVLRRQTRSRRRPRPARRRTRPDGPRRDPLRRQEQPQPGLGPPLRHRPHAVQPRRNSNPAPLTTHPGHDGLAEPAAGYERRREPQPRTRYPLVG
ncbi:HEAT repeat domain-containing protein [Kitasatospora indigofera]|uniref:HEAT repeat domain-containing protein n=1 Tax=Kitasatospora indigofera TaxID=67307 RepID=UPI00167DC4CB